MSCDHQVISHNLVDYMEGHLPPQLRKLCDEALLHCPTCRATHQQALAFAKLSHEWETQTVPHWNRTRFAVRPPVRKADWLSWGALATSCLTLLLVVFQLEISTQNGLLISFGGSQREAQLQAALSSQLEAFKSANAQALAAQLEEFSLGQNTANRLLLSEWLEKSRLERRQDMEFLMTTWESQRFQDRRQTDERLGYLARNQIESDQYINEMLQSTDYSERGPL